jgi:hypothetical protein
VPAGRKGATKESGKHVNNLLHIHTMFENSLTAKKREKIPHRDHQLSTSKRLKTIVIGHK